MKNNVYTIMARPAREEPINWDEIPVLKIDQVLWLPDAGIRAEGQLCYDEAGLNVHMRAVEENIRANLYKCGDFTAQRHYLAWMPIDLESPDFHAPEYFGRMLFFRPLKYDKILTS
ncbi:MAG: carbohydrate-binding family 9-like protein [Bacillota bacterium]|nr:carbohydrate-binding family 9-like protein [Bacillota bacterium]